MTLKKTLSVFLSAIMLFSVCSLGFTGAAAGIDYNARYDALAEALKNEHVRDLTNYALSNTTLDNGAEGFDAEANGFAYEHRVTAADNANGDILKAANSFYYIAETLLSTEYGKGCYDADTLIKTISANLKDRIASGIEDEKFYVDAYGNPYEPTDEELAAYDNVVSLITAAGGKVEFSTLLQHNIRFIEKNAGDYYNYETVLKYFVGNVVKINAGNWYHRFSFVVETSVDTCLKELEVTSISSPELTIRTAVYEFGYKREYNETQSKAFYSFFAPTLQKIWEDYGDEFHFDPESANLTVPVGGQPGLLQGGQASALMIKVDYDSTTVPYLQQAYNDFRQYISKDADEIKWDNEYIEWSDETVENFLATAPSDFLGYTAFLTSEYENDTLAAFFGDEIGNMITFTYLLKRAHATPSRTVRGDAVYEATPEKLNDIIYDLDALVSPGENTGNIAIAERVVSILKMFIKPDTMLGDINLSALDFNTLEELIGRLLKGFVFKDGIINMLMQKIYPMITDLLDDLVEKVDNDVPGGAGSIVGNLINDIINDNELAVYPADLAERIDHVYPGRYTNAARILRRAGNNWDNVNFETISWGVDVSPLEDRADTFLTAVCAGLSGFTKLLVTVLCGDVEYPKEHNTDNKYTKYFDRKVIEWLGILLRSQGLYTKLFIPLYKVLGLPDGMYFSSEEFHAKIDNNTTEKDCLKFVLQPLISWINEVLAKRPIQTLMTLLPNLTYFLSREGKVDVSGDKENWQGSRVSPDEKKKVHRGFAKLQTYSLYDILDSAYIFVDLSGSKLYSSSVVSLLKDKANMLKGLNLLLNEFLGFKYKLTTYESGIACYCDEDDTGEIVLPNSEEYGLNPDKYEAAKTVYYSDPSDTNRSLTQDADHPIKHENRIYDTSPYYIPAIPEQKLISCGEVNSVNTIDVENPGLVFLFLLRYITSALGYKYDGDNEDLPILIECFGLDLEKELINGLKLKDIIYNVMLHPDDAICALLELFYTNENGEYYAHRAYAYPLEKINYHENVLLSPAVNPTLTYGTKVRYTKYWTERRANELIECVEPLLTDIMIMLGNTDFAEGLGPYLENLINGFLTDDILNKLVNNLYQILGGMKGFGKQINVGSLLKNAVDVDISPQAVGTALEQMLGYQTQASAVLTDVAHVQTWKDIFFLGTEIDPATHEEKPIYGDVCFNWGLDECAEHGITRIDAFLKTLSALLSPASFLVRFLLMDEELDLLGLINIPSYAGYQYAFIGLLEALSCPGISSYREYYEAAQDVDCGDANTIYYLLSPIGKLLEKALENPIATVLELIPNLLFFISIGGLNDLLNNLVHIVYVLLDIVKPVINGYDLLGGLLSNIDLMGMKLNLPLPLDIDFNAFISELIDALLGGALTIKGVRFTLPYIDFHTLCCGTLKKFDSQEDRITVRLNAAGGGALLTAVLRLVFEFLFMDENKTALSQVISNLAGEGKLDEFDEETLYIIIDALFDLLENNDVPDMLLYVVYALATKLLPIADTLAERLKANDMSMRDVVAAASKPENFMATLELLMKDPKIPDTPGEITNVRAVGSLWERLLALFRKILLFFKKIFGLA